MKISPEQVRAYRLTRHHLDRKVPRRQLKRVVADLIGVQAQMPRAASLSLWARVDGITSRAIDEILYKRMGLARTWCLRGTAHLIVPEDRLLFAATLGKEIGGLYRAMQRKGYTESKIKRMGEAILTALEQGPLTRNDVKEALANRFPKESTEVIGSWGGILRILSQDGLVVFGPPRGTESTFVRADRCWPDCQARRPGENRLPELLHRYLRTYGPATLSDFAYWTGLTARQSRSALEKIESDLAEVEVDGKRSFLPKRDLPALLRTEQEDTLRLLPNFDVYLLGHRDKSLILEDRHYKAIFRAAGWVSAVVLKNGRVVGTWTTKNQGKKLHIDVELHEKLRRTERAILREEAESVGRFLGFEETTVNV